MACVTSLLAAAALTFGFQSSDAAKAPPKERPRVSAAPGSLVRWSVPGTKSCRSGKQSWKPISETCYFPVDLLQKPGVLRVARRGEGAEQVAEIDVGEFPYGTEEIDLGDIPQANPSKAEQARNAREQAIVARIWRRPKGPARFALPLGAPARSLPAPKTFGWRRIFNGRPAAQPHMGADYAMPTGTPVLAAADGTVVLARDLFYPGNAVFIDHGDGLITMYFHLSEIRVSARQEIAKGDVIGTVGETGRSSGPHLFFGVRWHGARIDPAPLLEDPAKIPSVGR